MWPDLLWRIKLNLVCWKRKMVTRMVLTEVLAVTVSFSVAEASFRTLWELLTKTLWCVKKVVEVSGFVKPFEEWYNRSLIVRTHDLKTLVKLDKLLKSHDGPKVSLKYVGGLHMLLIFEDLEEMLQFKDFDLIVKVWFSWLEIWKGQSLHFERIAWLKIMGVPLHLVDIEIFDSVGRIFGKVVHASMMSKDVNDLTFDLVGDLVGDGERINRSVMLKWNDKKFKIWVSEELGDWVPDCTNDVEDWEEKVDISSKSGKRCLGGIYPLHRKLHVGCQSSGRGVEVRRAT
ncbi:hypothetical protein Hdeb2414_s0020g00556941 [Helianthus debilis subsp. tardiflorus]